MIAGLYWFRHNDVGQLVCGVALSAAESLNYYCVSALAYVPIVLYNGRRGAQEFKYLFYVIYPVHLLALHLFAGWIDLYHSCVPRGQSAGPSLGPYGGLLSGPATGPYDGLPADPASDRSDGLPADPASGWSDALPADPASGPYGGLCPGPAFGPHDGLSADSAFGPSGGLPSGPATSPLFCPSEVLQACSGPPARPCRASFGFPGGILPPPPSSPPLKMPDAPRFEAVLC